MSEFFRFEIQIWTVNELTLYIRELLEGDEVLQDLWVQGEISNLSRPASGHVYFTLKDRESSLRCVMWRSTSARLSFAYQDGQAVEVHGNIGLYPVAGQYQLYVDAMRPVGEGALYQEFMRLKGRLEAEGLFDPGRKRQLPSEPKRIGIVTSTSGAALRDILNTLQRRFPLVEVILAPTPVQGTEAPPGIIAALERLNRDYQPDVILIARGGGSIEDLWAFNDEQVARAIAASKAPVISGIGHETDFTIADFVSDSRAPTPTAAAEIAVPDKTDLIESLETVSFQLQKSVEDTIGRQKYHLQGIFHRIKMRSPITRLHADRQRMDEMSHRMISKVDHLMEIHLSRLGSISEHLYSLSPLSTLRRGYAIISLPDGKLVRSVLQVEAGNAVAARLQDGTFAAEVKQIQIKNGQSHEH